MRRRSWLLLPLLVLVLAAAACGGGDNSTSSESEASPDASIPLETGDSATPAPAPTPSPAEPAEPAPSEATTEAPGAIPAGAAPIKKGSKKANILALQESLDYLGYSVGTPDGVFGAKTKKAINDFQKDNGIKASGVADKKTIAAINKQVKEAAAGTSPAEPPAQGDVTDTAAADTAAAETGEATLENTEDE